MEQSRREFLMSAAGLAIVAEPKLLARVAPSEYAKYDGLGLADLVKTKQVSPLELVEEVARAIEPKPARVRDRLPESR